MGTHMCKGVCARVRGWQKLVTAVYLTHILVAYQADPQAEPGTHQVGSIGWSVSPGDLSPYAARAEVTGNYHGTQLFMWMLGI